MASRRDQHHTHLHAVAALGKVLTRRAGSVCELCADSLDLRPLEVPPKEEEPSIDAAILACARCREATESKKLPRDIDSFRFLTGSIWSEVPPVQLAAVRLLRRLVEADVSWATEVNDELWLDEETEQRV